MSPRGIAGKCAAGTKLPAHGVCPQCGAGPDRECPRARIAEAEELERLRKQWTVMRNAIDRIEIVLQGWPELVNLPDQWGEPRHRGDIRVSVPGTCSQVYDVCDALDELNRIINSEEFAPRAHG